jgi:D-tyrosyl-tRNA(Tyr) deacylase
MPSYSKIESTSVRIVVQRVSQARVSVAKEIVGTIGAGLCVFVGVGKDDDEEDADNLADKVKSLRILNDEQGKMNRSVTDTGGEVLVVSQFTLYGDCRRGNRPSFTGAAPAEQAERLYLRFAQRLRDSGLTVATGRFQAHMEVSLVNDGPVTLVLESSPCG